MTCSRRWLQHWTPWVRSPANVYVIDEDSLANPIGSHLRIHGRARPGHVKGIGLDWLMARFVPPQSLASAFALAPKTQFSRADVLDAQKALSCGQLAAPLSAHQAFSNIIHAVSYTHFSVDPQPSLARSELCGASN
jgi:hypothetical protein